MVEEQLITNKKTGEELSLSIDNYYTDGRIFHGVQIVYYMVEIKRKRIVSKAAKKNAK